MQELPTAIPDVQILLSLSPEELAAKMLFLLRKRREEMFHPGNLQNELWQLPHAPNHPPQYPRQYEKAISVAIEEAWAWLYAQGLVIAFVIAEGHRVNQVMKERDCGHVTE